MTVRKDFISPKIHHSKLGKLREVTVHVWNVADWLELRCEDKMTNKMKVVWSIPISKKAGKCTWKLSFLYFVLAGSDEELSGSEEAEEEPRVKPRKESRRRKRRAISPVVFDRSSGESEGSSDESSMHVKSKVSKVSGSKKKCRLKLDNFFEGARYFVMKSNNHENVALSKAKVCNGKAAKLNTRQIQWNLL